MCPCSVPILREETAALLKEQQLLVGLKARERLLCPEGTIAEIGTRCWEREVLTLRLGMKM